MTLRQDNLCRLFESHGLRTSSGRPIITAPALADHGLLGEVKRVFIALGGSLEMPVLGPPPSGPGKWDMVVQDIPVELDEERHFNRYRRSTLKCPMYAGIRSFELENYRTYCIDREPDCLRAAGWRGNWTNPSCERQFGPSPPERQLEEPGPARWKQRAINDYLKDAYGVIHEGPVVRFSIWETVHSSTGEFVLGTLLKNGYKGDWTSAVLRTFEVRRGKTPARADGSA